MKTISSNTVLSQIDKSLATIPAGGVPEAKGDGTFEQWPPAASAAAVALAIDSAEIVNADVATVPAGSLIRSNGVALQFVRALFDTSAHAGGIIGTTTADVPVGGRIRINGCKTLPFDSAPVVGQMAYGSVTGLGKHTCSVPGTSSVMVPEGTVIADLSVGAAYAALVACPNTGMFSPASWEDHMSAETIALLGGEPSRWHTFGDHFDMPTQRAATGPQWGTLGDPSDKTSPVHLSCVKIGPRAGAVNACWYHEGDLLPLATNVKSLVCRFTVVGYLNPSDSRVAVAIFNGVTTQLCIVAGRNGTNIELICFDDSQGWYSGTPSPAQTQILGTVTPGTKQQIDLMIGKEGYFSARVLPNAWTPWRKFPDADWPYSAFAWARARNNQGSQDAFVEIDRVRFSIYE